MKVKDLIWKLQQIYNQEKQVYLGCFPEDTEQRIDGEIVEKEFGVYIQRY